MRDWLGETRTPGAKGAGGGGSKIRGVAEPAVPITALLLAWGAGDERALDQLVPVVYAELHRMAHRHLRREPHRSLQATSLVNELYVRLVDAQAVKWHDRAHFFAISSRLMRRILVDAARRRHVRKRGGGANPVTLDEAQVVAPGRGQDLIALDEALDALAAFDQRKARIVEMRFFAGLSVREIAAVLEVSEDTVTRDWNFAKTWLLRELSKR
jgi:RNA polymerase sigma factor (TIGR02999 family)